MHSRLIPLLALLATAAALSGCASTSHRSSSSNAAGSELERAESSIEIRYVLGHETRRLVALRSSERIEAKSFIGSDLLKGGSISEESFTRFLSRAETMMKEHGSRKPASGDCGNPFSIQLRAQGQSLALNGCRAQDPELSAAVSRLIREGELLVFSKN